MDISREYPWISMDRDSHKLKVQVKGIDHQLKLKGLILYSADKMPALASGKRMVLKRLHIVFLKVTCSCIWPK